MKPNRLLFWVLVFCGYAGTSTIFAAEGEHQSAPDKQLCVDLSQKTGQQYAYIEGKASYYYLFPRHNYECWGAPETCPPPKHSLYVINMYPLSDEENGFIVHTDFEHNDDIKSKPPYMKVGEAYSFCARPVEGFDFLNVPIPENIRVYKIDAPETIQVLNKDVQ